jgi:hypothetical protein
MEALRFISNVKNNQILLEIPADFTSEEVEIIVLPVTSKADKKEKLNRLLKISVWDDEAIDLVEEAAKGVRNWEIEKS